MPLANEDVESLLARQKRITQPIMWKAREDREGLEVDVAVGFLNPESSHWELGRLKAITVPGRRVRCALLYANIPLRRLCDAHASFHKHTWRDGHERERYVPTELRPTEYLGSPDEALLDFMKECTIELKAPHQRLLI